jgi:hypothetical protein
VVGGTFEGEEGIRETEETNKETTNKHNAWKRE